MDFLTVALYSSDETGAEKLTGALITRFDPEKITSRAKVMFVSAEDIKSKNGIDPKGFDVDADGVLLSDTQARRGVHKELAEYVGEEINNSSLKLGLIDVVLYGAAYGAHIIQNYEEYSADRENVDPIAISMVNLKVSNSSFNIYAPYKNVEGKFRTFSLMDITKDENYPFVMAVPEDQLENFAPVLSMMERLEEGVGLLNGYTLYRVDAPLEPFHTFTGEAFCNYLAYNVAYYRMGMRIIKDFLKESYKEEPALAIEEAEEEEELRTRKTPLHNVKIEAPYKTPKISEVVALIEQPDLLKERCRDDEEVYMSFIWLNTIFKTANDYSGNQSEEALMTACSNLLHECRQQLLHYSCELLAQRYYICKSGPFEDMLGPVLKGGGVNGYSFKRFAG